MTINTTPKIPHSSISIPHYHKAIIATIIIPTAAILKKTIIGLTSSILFFISIPQQEQKFSFPVFHTVYSIPHDNKKSSGKIKIYLSGPFLFPVTVNT